MLFTQFNVSNSQPLELRLSVYNKGCLLYLRLNKLLGDRYTVMNDIDFGLTGNFIDKNITANPTLALSIIG